MNHFPDADGAVYSSSGPTQPFAAFTTLNLIRESFVAGCLRLLPGCEPPHRRADMQSVRNISSR